MQKYKKLVTKHIFLIQHSEHPQRDAVAVAELRFIQSQETVGNVGDLIESLLAAAHLEEVFVIDKEIAMRGVFDLVQYTELAVKKRLPLVPFIHMRTKDMHEIGIAQVYFVGLV